MSVRRLAPKEPQPASFAFTPQNLAWAKKQVEQYPPGRQASAVIAILWRAQEQEAGWVSEAAIRVVADMLEMPYIRVLEVATFYTQFQLQPVGKKAHVQVCGTTPCMLRGAGDIIEVCQHRIHHDPFHLSADGDFSWEEVECLGACVNAPMAMIWSDTYEDLTKENFGKVLDGFATGNLPQPGSQIGRQHAAPQGGPTTLKNGGAVTKSIEPDKDQAALTDGEAKKPTDAANRRESPAPKPPADDATRKGKS
jgi:NADH-quinone oxidoreductase subunit E